MAAVDGVGGQRHGLTDVIGVSGGDESGGGVEDDHIATRRAFAVEHGANDGGVLLRVIASGDLRQSGARFRPNSSGVTS